MFESPISNNKENKMFAPPLGTPLAKNSFNNQCYNDSFN